MLDSTGKTTFRLLLWLVALALLAMSAGAQTAKDDKKPEQDFWNKVFADPTTTFNKEPSKLLVDAVHERKDGAAIDLGMGEGRNAIFLAQQGWHVTGVDISDLAVGRAKKRAAELAVPLETAVADLDEYDLGREKWDVISLFYMQGWYHLSKLNNAQRLKDALKPGGLLVIEGFAGGDVGYQTNELLRAFGDLKILRYEDAFAEADWAPGEKSHVIKFVAQKPN